MSSLFHSIVAQDTASPTINVSAVYNRLKIELENVLNKHRGTKNIRMLIDRLVNEIHRLSDMKVAEDILYHIFYPFGTRAFDHESEVRRNR